MRGAAACRIGLALLLIVLAAGCPGDGSQIVDDMMGGDTANPPNMTISPTLSSLQANVFGAICTDCHFPGGPGPFSLESEQETYDNLVNVVAAEVMLLRVAPGDPENSYLVHKIEGRPGIVLDRMPPPPQPMLTQEQIDAIVLWIAMGAQP